MTPIAIATEDQLSEAIALRLIAEVKAPHRVALKLGTKAPKNLLLRIAVREVESWVLADHVAMRALMGVKGVLPVAPDELADPKQSLLRLAKGAPRQVRDDLMKAIGGNLAQGLGYNARLSAWVHSDWCPQRAAERSPSLARARLRLDAAVRDFA